MNSDQAFETSFNNILAGLLDDSLSYTEYCNIVKELWRLSDRFDTKTLLLEPHYNLLPIFAKLLANPFFAFAKISAPSDEDLDFQIFGCLWFLSRAIENRERIANKSHGVLPLLLGRIRIEKYTDMIMNVFTNCSIDVSTHRYLLSDELGYLSYINQRISQNSNDVHIYRALNYATPQLSKEGATLFHWNHLLHPVVSYLLQIGPYPLRWIQRFFGPEYWALNTLMDVSFLPTGAIILLEFPIEAYLMTIVMFKYSKLFAEQLKSFITLLNIWFYCDYLHEQNQLGYCSSIPFNSFSNFNHSQDLGRRLYHILRCTETIDAFSYLDFLLAIFTATMNYSEPQPEMVSGLSRRGWAFGVIALRIITQTFYCLCVLEQQMESEPYHHKGDRIPENIHYRGLFLPQSISIRNTLLVHETFLADQIRLLSLFVKKIDGIRFFDRTGYIVAGGGKDDPETIINILRTLLLLLCQPSGENRILLSLLKDQKKLQSLKELYEYLLLYENSDRNTDSDANGYSTSENQITISILFSMLREEVCLLIGSQ